MKKTMVAIIILVLFLTGCSFNAPQNSNEDMKKQSKIEIYSVQDETLLKTIDDQDTVNNLLETNNWKQIIGNKRKLYRITWCQNTNYSFIRRKHYYWGKTPTRNGTMS